MNSLIVFLRRIRHCAGFGVQSPTDFAFVREVIYERLPYYAYEDIASSYPQCKGWRAWQARLLLRVSNFAQADKMAYCGGNVPETDAFAIGKGCSRTGIIPCSSIEKLQTYINEGNGWIVIPDIHNTNNSYFEYLKKQEHIIIYDLYYLAVAFIDRKRYSEVHIINPY